MITKFISLLLCCFKSHKQLSIRFSDITTLSGPNGAGKSSIGEAITWILFGVDPLGSKFDPTPTTYEFDECRSELIIERDGNHYKFGRSIKGGKTTYHFNDVPVKATEFDEKVSAFFDKTTFLSQFNPAYFFSMHWKEQRRQILQYVPEPVNKEVFLAMSRTSKDQKPADITLNQQAATLAELVKKHSLSDLEKIHKDNKTRKEKEEIAAKSRTKTLQEQLQLASGKSIDVEAATARIATLEAEIAKEDEAHVQTANLNLKINQLRSNYENFVSRMNSLKQRHASVKSDIPKESCTLCGQSLPDEAKQTALAKHADQVKAIAEEHNTIREDTVKIKAELDVLLASRSDVPPPDIQAMRNEVAELRQSIKAQEGIAQLQQQIESAQKAEETILASLRESIFILDAIKAYFAKQAAMMADKIGELFTPLSFKIFEVQKNGDINNDVFEIEMDGKPYSKLSVGEKIKAGLTLVNVLQKQSELVLPCMVDNAESYTGEIMTAGQTIICRAIDGEKKLDIQTADMPF